MTIEAQIEQHAEELAQADELRAARERVVNLVKSKTPAELKALVREHPQHAPLLKSILDTMTQPRQAFTPQPYSNVLSETIAPTAEHPVFSVDGEVIVAAASQEAEGSTVRNQGGNPVPGWEGQVISDVPVPVQVDLSDVKKPAEGAIFAENPATVPANASVPTVEKSNDEGTPEMNAEELKKKREEAKKKMAKSLTEFISKGVDQELAVSATAAVSGLPSEIVSKAYDLLKAGEGSRGGRVIGHTKSGKPIYNDPKHSAHAGFSSKDHEDAVAAYDKPIAEASSDGRADAKAKMREAQDYHHDQSVSKQKQPVRKSDPFLQSRGNQFSHVNVDEAVSVLDAGREAARRAGVYLVKGEAPKPPMMKGDWKLSMSDKMKKGMDKASCMKAMKEEGCPMSDEDMEKAWGECESQDKDMKKSLDYAASTLRSDSGSSELVVKSEKKSSVDDEVEESMKAFGAHRKNLDEEFAKRHARKAKKAKPEAK